MGLDTPAIAIPPSSCSTRFLTKLDYVLAQTHQENDGGRRIGLWNFCVEVEMECCEVMSLPGRQGSCETE